MPVRPPDPDDLRAVAEHYGLGLDDADLASFSPMVNGLIASWDAVEELYAASAPPVPERSWSRPEPADNPYNAWYVTCEVTGDGEGPLAGKTVAVKDNTSVAGIPLMNGSTTMEGYTPRRDATIVARMLAAGATIAGKSVCEDLCFSGGSHTSRTGAVRNPWDETRSTGGSSSGTAALVASGLVDVGTGGDQGGSIRMPASWSGIVGHKPTWGLVPYTGAFPIEQSIDHVGPMTRTVADAA
ncbi:MAG: amidase family protein, partial [Pseudonocardiales bacterium]|nr:amidase family protein [Pseudonocardiales bacterium]